MRLIILIILLSIKCIGVTTCSVQASTNWTLASTWSCGHVPNISDNIFIPNGFTVTITTSIDLTAGSNTYMVISGNLFFSGNSSTLLLPSTATVNLTSTGVVSSDVSNNSQKFKIGNNTIWTGNQGTVTGPSIATSSGGALPIELIYFNVECLVGVKLNWATATELNNDYFILERSLDGIYWSLAIQINGNGTTNLLHTYTHTDSYIPIEVNYYRLSQVDLDGTITILRTIDIICKYNSINKMTIYPNPTSTVLNIDIDIYEYNSNNAIKFVNNLGQVLIETRIDLVKGLNTFAYPIYFEPGAYTIVFYSNDIPIISQKIYIIR